MKKYRPIKLWLILLLVTVFGGILGGFLMDGWKQVLMLICTGVIFAAFILSTTYYVQFQKDRIVIRHGLSSFNKSYRSNFKTRHILFSDIIDLSINYSSKYVIISLKDGNNIMFNFNGYSGANQIIDELKNVKNELSRHNR